MTITRDRLYYSFQKINDDELNSLRKVSLIKNLSKTMHLLTFFLTKLLGSLRTLSELSIFSLFFSDALSLYSDVVYNSDIINFKSNILNSIDAGHKI